MSDNEELVKAVFQRARDVEGKKVLNCAEAFRLARESSAEMGEIGRICNEQNIRICNCQLGCFK